MWGTLLQQHNKWFTKLIDEVSLFYQHYLCFHSKENGHCKILHYICSDKFFGALTDPILLHIVTHQGIFFLLSYFWLPYCFLMGIRFSSSCVFIFYIVFSFSLVAADVCNTWKLFDRKKNCLALITIMTSLIGK